jgi:hypothetical protein
MKRRAVAPNRKLVKKTKNGGFRTKDQKVQKKHHNDKIR